MPARAESHPDTDFAAATRYRIRRHARQPDRCQNQPEHAEESVDPQPHADQEHQFLNLFGHTLGMERGEVVVHCGDLAAHRGDSVHSGDGAHHQRDAGHRRLRVVGGPQRKIDRRRGITHLESGLHILDHADHFEHLPCLGGGAGAGVQYGYRVQSARRGVIAADLDAASQRVLALPALAPQLLADDDGRRAIRLVFLTKRAAQQHGNSKSLEVVSAYDILPGIMDHARTRRPRRHARKRHVAIAHERHRDGPGEAGGGDRRQAFDAVRKLLEEGRRLLARIAVAHRIQRDQIEVPGIKARVDSGSAMESQHHESGEQQEHQ